MAFVSMRGTPSALIAPSFIVVDFESVEASLPSKALEPTRMERCEVEASGVASNSRRRVRDDRLGRVMAGKRGGRDGLMK